MNAPQRADDLPAVDHSVPLLFLGLADGAALENPVGPLEAWTLFKLARIKVHFLFPAITKEARWCFLIRTDAFQSGSHFRIQIVNTTGAEQGHIDITSPPIADASPAPPAPVQASFRQAVSLENQSKSAIAVDGGQWILQCVSIPDLVIAEPSEYRLLAHWGDRTSYLGRVFFGYIPYPPLTEEQISAYEADPVSPKFAQVALGCKHCDSKLRVYAAANKSEDQEAKGYMFYRDLRDRFKCGCGATDMPLQYLRESMQGLLNREARISIGDISYVQRYAHSQLLDIASSFLTLVQRENHEEPIQHFLATHKVLFARYHPRHLFVKPRILGKFNADFAILDSEGVLTLIEIERASMRLFKRNGHLRGDLNHAYEQVQDWINEVIKHRSAVIEGLGLKPDEVLSIRACVIAGRSEAESREHLRRHMSQPRPGVEFLTLDMLGDSLVRIAHDLP